MTTITAKREGRIIPHESSPKTPGNVRTKTGSNTNGRDRDSPARTGTHPSTTSSAVAIVADLLVTQYRPIAPANQNPKRENLETHEQSNPHKSSALGLTLPERLPEVRRFADIDYLQCPTQARIFENSTRRRRAFDAPHTRQLRNNSTAGKLRQRRKESSQNEPRPRHRRKRNFAYLREFRSGSSIPKKESTRRRKR